MKIYFEKMLSLNIKLILQTVQNLMQKLKYIISIQLQNWTKKF